MAKAKKVQKYVPSTKYPARKDYTLLVDAKYNDYDHVVSLYDTFCRAISNHYDNCVVDDLKAKVVSNEIKKEEWKLHVASWHYDSLMHSIWPYTPEFVDLNNRFMAEYESREDLQEIYKDAAKNTWWWYDTHGKSHNRNDAETRGWVDKPATYMMFRQVIRRGHVGEKIELARETPYQEGDLVLLRLPYVGHKRIDPMYIDPWSEEGQAGQTTPDRSMLRLGTVVSVTEKTAGWRSGKGTKIIQLIWIGKEDVVDVEEKYIKWHERPTIKNGMIKKE